MKCGRNGVCFWPEAAIATLAAIAALAPQTLEDLQGVSRIGAKKLEAYGEEVLRVSLLNE